MKADLMLLPHGDSAIDIVLDNVISSTVNARVHALSRQIQHASFDGILGCIPAYRTLTVEYDPLRVTYGQLCLFLRSLPAPDTEAEQSQGRLLHIPVCYGEVFGPDLEEVASHAHLSVAEVIRRHALPDYHVFMLGFRPGFPYLGGMDPSIACPRRATPRQSVRGGSVGIAGEQTGVYPEPSPGGWNIIGCTPLSLFDEKALSLIQPGDTIRFVPVDESSFREIERSGRWEL